VDPTQPLEDADYARAEGVLWRAERMSEAEALAIDSASPPGSADPPELAAADTNAWAIARGAGYIGDKAALGERSERAAVAACGTRTLEWDFVRNFRPEATVISTIEHAWVAALVGNRLPGGERDLLDAAWRAIPATPEPDWFGPRTEAVEAFIRDAAKVTRARALDLGRRYDAAESKRLHEELQSEPAFRGHPWSAAAAHASSAAARALWGREYDFGRVPGEDPLRYGTFLVGHAAMAECLREVAGPELIARLEGPWLSVMSGPGTDA
jgi:hypothetical protein